MPGDHQIQHLPVHVMEAQPLKRQHLQREQRDAQVAKEAGAHTRGGAAITSVTRPEHRKGPNSAVY